MNKSKQFRFALKTLSVLIVAAIDQLPAMAAEDSPKAANVVNAPAISEEMAKLIRPNEGAYSIGIGGMTQGAHDRALFGQYNGWQDAESPLLLDFAHLTRDELSGVWKRLDARNLGQDTRELGIMHSAQGDWTVAFEVGELVRHDPRSINSTPAGNNVSALSAIGAGVDQNLTLKRTSYSLSGDKWLGPGVQIDASFKSEDKQGSRRAGVGGYCSNAIAGYYCPSTQGALLLLAEPIDSSTRQFDLNANFSGDQYSVTVGYYGSIYRNRIGSITPGLTGNLLDLGGTGFDPTTGGTSSLANLLNQRVASPPDNQSQQLYLRGSYALTPTIRSNFNLSRTHATQNESFSGMGLSAPAGTPNSLDGEVNTTFAQFGLSARPMPKLSMRADWRYEDKKDETPIAAYNAVSTNTPNSLEKANGKAEASYQLPDNYRVTVGVDYAWIKREKPVTTTLIPAASMTTLREWTREIGYNAELRHAISGQFQAAIGFAHSKRDGSHWLSLASGADRYQEVRDADVVSATGVAPSTSLDRERDKLRLMADWMPFDELSLQFIVEDGKDDFSGPTGSGLHSTDMRNVAIDATYTLSESWKLSGYVNSGDQGLNVSHQAGYTAQLENSSTHVGVRTQGTLSNEWSVGGDLSYLKDRNRYTLTSGNADAADSLPDVKFTVVALKLFGTYTLDKASDVRIDVAHQRIRLDEWTWSAAGVPYVYSDNSTVNVDSSQNVTYLGARYVYKFK